MSLFPIFAPATAAAATVTYTDNKVSDAASTAVRTFQVV